jgi:hypothetical protein
MQLETQYEILVWALRGRRRKAAGDITSPLNSPVIVGEEGLGK